MKTKLKLRVMDYGFVKVTLQQVHGLCSWALYRNNKVDKLTNTIINKTNKWKKKHIISKKK